jgi:monofunctional glycosyltransferase
VCLLAFEGYALLDARRALNTRIAPFQTGHTALSVAQFDAIVKVQDPTFRNHGGVEWPSPLTTTTITQSLVKRLFFNPFRPGIQKLEQTLIAWMIVDPNISKNTQLHAFAQTAYFGHKDGQAVIGFEAAAMAWFNAYLKELTNDQFLSLLAMLPAPNALAPGSAQSAERVVRIKRLLSGKCNHTRIADIQLEQCKE